MNFKLAIPPGGLVGGPVSYAPSWPAEPRMHMVLVDGRQQEKAAQIDREGRIWWIEGEHAEQTEVGYRLVSLPTAEKYVRLERGMGRAGRVDVKLGDHLLTTFHYPSDLPKPFLYPVYGPTGATVTRDYPMVDNPAERETDRQDHPHHRSIWVAYGDIRIHDLEKAEEGNNWHEGPECSLQKVRRIIRCDSGPVFGEVEAEVEWIDARGEHQLTEYRMHRFYRQSDPRQIVFDTRVRLDFDRHTVMFADTKEGGVFAIRLAVTMDEVGQGRMCNSRGGAGEQECWGRPAEWCDYAGPVEGRTVGVAVFDHPANFRHPTRWHIRSYGLFTANPFGLSHFDGDDANGSKIWEKGDSAIFNYRTLIHEGDTQTGRVEDHWRLYGQPPQVG